MVMVFKPHARRPAGFFVTLPWQSSSIHALEADDAGLL